MRKWFAISLMFLAIVCSPVLFADADDAPMQITVAVTDHSDTALQQGLHAAFSQAVIEMSNDLQVTALPTIQNASSHVTQWVQSYSYVDSQNAAAPGLSLQVIFDRNGLEQLLREAKQHTAAATIENASSMISMYISGVRNISDYSRITQALRENKNVQEISVKNMNADSVLLEVKMTGNATDFQQALSIDNRFIPISAELRSRLVSADLYYDWTGNQA